MSLSTAKVKISLFHKGQQVFPGSGDILFPNSYVTAPNAVTIAAGAVDQEVKLDNKGTTKFILLRTDIANKADLSFKVDSSSDVYAINPIAILTENISSIKVTNSDPDKDKVLEVGVISE